MNTAFAQRMSGVSGSAIRELFRLMGDPQIISFGGGNPNKATFPVQAVEEIIRDVMQQNGADLLQYGATEGYMPLRQSVLEHMVCPKGVKADVENIIITTGSMQALAMLTKTMIDPGDAILVESPTFLGALQCFHSYQANCIPVEMDDDGVIIADLEAKIQQYHPKMFYCIPTFQNPTGKTLSPERRKQVAQLAAKYNIIVAEDDPYCELRYEGEAVPPIKSFDETGNVVMLCSFSKILSPGLRVGAAIGQEEIIRKITMLKQSGDTHTSNLSQAIADQFLRRGMLKPHLERICPLYKEQMDTMLGAIKEHFPAGCTFTKPQGGLFVWGNLPAMNCSMLDFAKRCAQEAKVAFVPGQHFYADPNTMGLTTLRLNFSACTPEQIQVGVERLAQLVKQVI